MKPLGQFCREHPDWTIFAVALFVRLAFIGYCGPNRTPPPYDDHAFNQIASTLVREHRYENVAFPVGYPLFLAAVYQVFGPSWLIGRLVNALLGAATCVLLTQLGRKVFTERQGLLAGAALAVYPGHVFFAWRVMAESLFIFLLLTGLLLALNLAEKPRLGRGIILGLVFGWAQLVKPHLMFLPPLVLVWFLVVATAAWQRRLLVAAGIVAGLAVMMSVTPLINAAATGQGIAMPGSPGLVLWQGNNPVADGFDQIPDKTPAGAAFIREHGYKERLEQASNFFERNRLYRELALLWIRENPGRFAMLCLLKLENAFSPVPRARVFDNNRSARPVYLLTFGPVAVLALLGLVVAAGHRRKVGLLYLVLLSYLPTVCIFFGTPRFTILVTPVLMLFSAAGATWLWDRLNRSAEVEA